MLVYPQNIKNRYDEMNYNKDKIKLELAEIFRVLNILRRTFTNKRMNFMCFNLHKPSKYRYHIVG